MVKTNVKKTVHTHEGAVAKQVNAEQMLRRSVLSCLLWEKEFYEDGISIAERIASLVPQVASEKVSALAIEARSEMNLRHVPLWIVRLMASWPDHKHLVAETLAQVIQRPDEITEFLSLYWANGKQPLSAQVKKGLAAAFTKFSEYQLAKYDRPGAVRLRDALFLCHANPKDSEQEALWKRLIDGELTVPDTWEVALSGGADKGEAFSRLMAEKKLGGLAFLRNLRNMLGANVPLDTIKAYMTEANFERVLPFRFITAARYAPMLEPELEVGMLKALGEQEKLPGQTVMLVDVSGSMCAQLSSKSEMTRMDAACALAILLREICESVRVITFSQSVVEVPPRRGFALRDAIVGSQHHGGTYLGQAVTACSKLEHDRLVVFTDEQSHDQVPDPKARLAYVLNVASAENGVGYGPWTHVDGFSEAVIKWMTEHERTLASNPVD